MLHRLESAEEVTIDGTSRCLPVAPEAAQLLTFHIKHDQQEVTALYVLCEERSCELYRSIWKVIINKCLILKENITTITCHYDEEWLIATREMLPHVSIRESWFHFIKLLSRKWNSLELPANYDNDICKISWIFKIIPKDKIDLAIEVIKESAEEDADNFENLILYSRFITKISKLISSETFIGITVNDAINIAENHNQHLITNFGSGQPIYKFLRNLRTDIRRQEENWVNTPMKKPEIRITTEISNLQKKLKSTQTIQSFTREVMKSKVIDFIKIQLNWPQYKDDSGKLNGFPKEKYFFPILVNKDDLINVCLFCLSEEASVQLIGCNHFVGCYGCWIKAHYDYNKRNCPACRAPYNEFQIY
ncbi:uncharacterized protein LOC130673839 [Microplitis mediator]|uniref:uncharacterized protein LOC130673839 n=1 Tax=Microplitis mediator TaxID=375433 RepID=UPI002552E727|nr:uncharacterized protein LOC130673839 [Microplitis mediator]XP_057335043.1 uncharacterized protein LOC130673839 [Microplitis mediator]XP_057335048.1 uncharacterized protein LOC130673839 [Microplitis mediator]XP_057335053.1 uncharacterized protein LOC130673839 [Microplitis mediator]XP_057335057.1 uncharacterized protein LOC130673839 [Microplitis mediator]